MKITLAQASDEADQLIGKLLGGPISGGGNPTPALESAQTLEPHEAISHQVYRLPIQVGISNEPLDAGDKPWFVGHFSPNAPTDKNHAFHNGVDQKASKGTPIYPMADGIVESTGSSPKSGNFISILYEEGKVRSFYAHLDSIKCQQGDRVSQNDVVGLVGDTGNAKGRGAHLHFETRINGSLIDPKNLVGKPVGSVDKKAHLADIILKLAENFLEFSRN